jgi:hypothetical protein
MVTAIGRRLMHHPAEGVTDLKIYPGCRTGTDGDELMLPGHR